MSDDENLKYGRETPEERALRMERELLERFDRSLEATMELIDHTPRLQQQAPEMGRGPEFTNPEIEVEIERHAEQVAKEDRQKFMEQTLESQGIDPKRMTDMGHARSKPPERIYSAPEREEQEKIKEAKASERNLPPVPLVHDSPERRAAIKEHLTKLGVDQHLQAVRLLFEVGNAKPPSAAVNRSPENAPDAKGQEKEGPSKGLERGRDE